MTPFKIFRRDLCKSLLIALCAWGAIVALGVAFDQAKTASAIATFTGLALVLIRGIGALSRLSMAMDSE